MIETRNYFIYVHFCLSSGYAWPTQISQIAATKTFIPLTELSSFKVFLNGKEYSGAGYVKYSSVHDEVEVGIPIANDITSITLSQSSFPYDGEVKKPRVVSARLINGDLVGNRMYTVSYVDQNNREVDPVNPGTYYALLKGTGIYGTGRKAFTITGKAHVHTWDSGIITTPPTTTSNGIMTYTCTTCGETRTEIIDQLKITIPKNPSLSNPKGAKNKITIKLKHFKNKSKNGKKIWKSIKKIQVQCATDRDFKNIVRTASVGKAKTKITIKGLRKKTTYFVRVRYYDGTGYSSWSGVKKVKTK